MTVITIYALIGMALSILFTLVFPFVSAALFGTQWGYVVAAGGGLMFISWSILGAMSMPPRKAG